jgi:hypothetical protein
LAGVCAREEAAPGDRCSIGNLHAVRVHRNANAIQLAGPAGHRLSLGETAKLSPLQGGCHAKRPRRLFSDGGVATGQMFGSALDALQHAVDGHRLENQGYLHFAVGRRLQCSAQREIRLRADVFRRGGCAGPPNSVIGGSNRPIPRTRRRSSGSGGAWRPVPDRPVTA